MFWTIGVYDRTAQTVSCAYLKAALYFYIYFLIFYILIYFIHVYIFIIYLFIIYYFIISLLVYYYYYILIIFYSIHLYYLYIFIYFYFIFYIIYFKNLYFYIYLIFYWLTAMSVTADILLLSPGHTRVPSSTIKISFCFHLKGFYPTTLSSHLFHECRINGNRVYDFSGKLSCLYVVH